VARLFESAASVAAHKAKRSAEHAAQRAKPIGLVVGDVLRSSWGYDQTNIDYYQVTAVVGAQMVEIREIAQQREETHWQTGVCVPAPGQFTGEPMRKRVSDYGNRDSVRIASYASAYKVEAKAIGGMKLYSASNWSATH
jgi:hypothetical protein